MHRNVGHKTACARPTRLSETIAATVGAGDIVIFSGSLPPGAPDDCYRALIESCRDKGALAFLDSSGEALREGIKAKPYLIKPNRQEFAELTGLTSAAEQDFVAAARKIVAQGVAWVYVSRGAQGALAVGEGTALAARSDKLPGKIRSRVGCGDALLAGVAVAMLKGLALEDVIKTGVACGAANLFNVEPGRLDKPLLPDLLLQAEVCRL